MRVARTIATRLARAKVSRLSAEDDIAIREAVASDIGRITDIDESIVGNRDRSAMITHAVASRECTVATIGDEVCGFAVIDRSFFEHRFIRLLGVDRRWWRCGIGAALLRGAVTRARGEKLFTSTNTSNGAMKRLLERRGFVPSGVIENLDDDDPELVFVNRG